MKKFLAKAVAAALGATLLASAAYAAAGYVTFLSNKGDVTLPFAAPQGSNPGTIDNMTVGANTPEPGTFTTLDATTLGGTVPPNATVSQFHLDTGTKTATATAGAATLNKMSGTVTSESLTTAAGATYTLTVTDSDIAAADIVGAAVQLGTATTGMPTITTTTPAAGSVVIVVQNIHASAALNGTIKIAFWVLKN